MFIWDKPILILLLGESPIKRCYSQKIKVQSRISMLSNDEYLERLLNCSGIVVHEMLWQKFMFCFKQMENCTGSLPIKTEMNRSKLLFFWWFAGTQEVQEYVPLKISSTNSQCWKRSWKIYKETSYLFHNLICHLRLSKKILNSTCTSLKLYFQTICMLSLPDVLKKV